MNVLSFWHGKSYMRTYNSKDIVQNVLKFHTLLMCLDQNVSIPFLNNIYIYNIYYIYIYIYIYVYDVFCIFINFVFMFVFSF